MWLNKKKKKTRAPGG